MLRPVRTVAPATALVSLDDIKAQVRVPHVDDDALLTALIEAATSRIDGYAGILGRAIVSQTWTQDFDGFANDLRLPLGNLVSITDVKYYDATNTQQTASATLYSGLEDECGPYVTLKYGQAWPSTYNRPDAVKVTWVCGYGAVVNVPAAVVHAVKMLAAHWYENREAVVIGDMASEVPLGVRSLLAPHCRIIV
jgi:uncharacterized phiE125 gp8 family phage protein